MSAVLEQLGLVALGLAVGVGTVWLHDRRSERRNGERQWRALEKQADISLRRHGLDAHDCAWVTATPTPEGTRTP